jgi:hypothetical protein
MDEISYPLEVAQRIGADLRELRAENERLRAKLASARAVALACLKRMREAGESHEMCARWISEELSK